MKKIVLLVCICLMLGGCITALKKMTKIDDSLAQNIFNDLDLNEAKDIICKTPVDALDRDIFWGSLEGKAAREKMCNQ